LGPLIEHFPTRNGYIIFSPNEPKFPKYDSKDYYKFLLSSQVFYHKEAQVTTGHRTKLKNVKDGDTLDIVQNPKLLIDQVMCAAVNIGQGRTGIDNKKIYQSETKCRFVLDLAYQGTYLNAINNHRSQIFLTLVGGGAFANPKEWIYDAIVKAHTKWAIEVFGSQEGDTCFVES